MLDSLRCCLTRVWALLVKTFVVVLLFFVALFSATKIFSRFFFWSVYRQRVFGLDNIPTGPALLIGNCVSYLDELAIASRLKRKVWFVVSPEKARRCFPIYVASKFGFFNVCAETGDALRKRARQILAQGDLLCVFPEGDMTRSGRMKAFDPEFLRFLDAAPSTPIVPFYIGGIFGSLFTFARGRALVWRPRRLAERFYLAFGKPFFAPTTPLKVEETVAELGVDASRQIDRRLQIPQRKMIDVCRAAGRKLLVADGTGTELSGVGFLLRALVVRRFLRRKILAKNELNVGLLLPTSVGGCVVNAALALDRRVSVNLNYTFGSDVLNYCCASVGVRRILTSRKVIERFPNLKFDAKIIYLEDILAKVSIFDKIVSAVDATCAPKFLLRFKLGLCKAKDSDVLSILFTSGSTGKPKGVEISNGNVAHVARGFFDSIHIGKNDVVLAVLPLFHAFGYVGNFWLTFLSGCRGIFHFNPLDAKKVGELAKKYRCTFLCCTPTFLRNYWRRCPKDDFENVHTVMTGAEKLPVDLIDAWEKKFDVRPSEGYGATELSPCPITNVPDIRAGFYRNDYTRFFLEKRAEKRALALDESPQNPSVGCDEYEIYRKDGSIGRALAGSIVKIVDRETGEDCDVDETGLIAVKGGLVMKGYFGLPDLTKRVVRNGWYISGDVGRKDKDGFVWIIGRESRISKIGGEMVPHLLIEETIERILVEILEEKGVEILDGAPLCAVTAVPDEKKGEALVVLYVPLGATPEAVYRRMKAKDFPNLWIPATARFIEVEQVPILQTGKLDLGMIRRVAEERFHIEKNI